MDDDQTIERMSSCPWNNLRSLSYAAWKGRPTDSPHNLRSVFAAVHETVTHNGSPIHRVRLMPRTTEVVAVYVKPMVDRNTWVALFWANNNTCKRSAETVAATSDSVAPIADPPTFQPNPKSPVSVKTAGADIEAASITDRPLPTQRRDGAYNLVTAVLRDTSAPLTTEAVAQRKARIDCLDRQFVLVVAVEWPVLFPKRGKNISEIWTFIDVVRDPIVPQLRDWLLGTEDPSEADPPPYPAVGAADLRPSEPVPPELSVSDVNHLLLVVNILSVRNPPPVLLFCMNPQTPNHRDVIPTVTYAFNWPVLVSRRRSLRCFWHSSQCVNSESRNHTPPPSFLRSIRFCSGGSEL